MEIAFTKLSDRRHRVTVARNDGSTETVELDSKDFLRHDLAHFAVETELGLANGVWGSVAAGGSLSGEGIDGADVAVAERLAGPIQTMMRIEADQAAIAEVLDRVMPGIASADLAARLHERLRSLRGHWAATGYGDAMEITWSLP